MRGEKKRTFKYKDTRRNPIIWIVTDSHSFRPVLDQARDGCYCRGDEVSMRKKNELTKKIKNLNRIAQIEDLRIAVFNESWPSIRMTEASPSPINKKPGI